MPADMSVSEYSGNETTMNSPLKLMVSTTKNVETGQHQPDCSHQLKSSLKLLKILKPNSPSASTLLKN